MNLFIYVIMIKYYINITHLPTNKNKNNNIIE